MVTKMIKLEKGAKLKVRMKDGSIKESVYDNPCIYVEKHHWVLIDGFSKIMGDFGSGCTDCRLIGNPCGLLHEGVSV